MIVLALVLFIIFLYSLVRAARMADEVQEMISHDNSIISRGLCGSADDKCL